MMMVEIDYNLCTQAEAVIQQLSLDMPNLSLFLTQVVLQQKAPFELTTEKETKKSNLV